MAELEASRGPRSWLVDGLTRLFGDNKTAAEYANKVGDAFDYTGLANAYDLGGDLGRAALDPSERNLLTAALTSGTMLAFSNPVARAAGMAAKDAGRTARIFAGRMAKGADMPAFTRAQNRIEQGAGLDTVWQETGWNPNIADQGVWEINDELARYTGPQGSGATTNHKLPDVFDHPELYENYPGLKNVEVRVSQHPSRQLGFKASWDRTGGHSGRITLARDASPEDARSYILHELQHAVQDIEGFPRGSNPRTMQQLYFDNNPEIRANARDINTDSPYAIALEQYARAAGEVEARNVQTRSYWTEHNRRNLAPWTSEDRDRERQIILDGEYVPQANPARKY